MQFHNPALEQTRMCNRGSGCAHHASGTCWFAHSEEELRCRTYATTGVCTLRWSGHCTVLHDIAANTDVHLTIYESPLLQDPMSHGVRPAGSATIAYERPLKMYPLPVGLEELVGKSKSEVLSHAHRRRLQVRTEEYMKDAKVMAEGGLRPREKLFESLLHVEEIQNMNDMRAYDLEGTDLRVSEDRNSLLWCIDVPGLAEKRPSVIRGDEVIAVDWHRGTHTGYVHFVNNDHVVVSFSDMLETSTDFKMVTFSCRRTQYRAQLRALELGVFSIETLVCKPPQLALSLAHATPLNKQQRLFAMMVLSPKTNMMVCWGPPGTGKTTTIVSTMAEVCASRACRILVVAPSNTAAHNITERFATHYPHLATKASILHVHALYVATKSVPDVVLRHSDVQGCDFVFPTKARVMGMTVLVCTLSVAARLYGIGVPCTHFTHVFVDEAGQATFPEMQQALTLAKTAVVALAGDHKQLGPVVRSSAANDHGLGVSALEMFAADLASDMMVMLTDNYRSHASIVDIVNLHYDDKLVPMASGAGAGRTKHIVFRHVQGKEEKEMDSPSWMNRAEYDEVMLLIQAELSRGTRPSDIVVLAPYLKQVQKIRGILHYHISNSIGLFAALTASYNPRGRTPIEVSTVECFQGKESPVVILSCVRSKQADQIDQDVYRQLGFIRQPRRVNVALSRAKDVMYIVGNANTLQNDRMWWSVIARLQERGVEIGNVSSKEPFMATERPPLEDGAMDARDRKAAILAKATNAFDTPWRTRE